MSSIESIFKEAKTRCDLLRESIDRGLYDSPQPDKKNAFQEKLQEINIDQLPDVMYAINFNNHIVLYEGVNFNHMLYSKLNSRTLISPSLIISPAYRNPK